MKPQIFLKPLAAIVSVMMITVSAWCGPAENSPSETTRPTAQAASPLTYGVADVLKLSGAKIGDDTIVSYIQNSGTSFGGLSASEIVYLHEQGVSDRVVTSMLEQRRRLSEGAAPFTTPPYATPTAPLPTTIIASAPQVYTPPTPSIIVMHDSSPRLVDYGIYPRYGFGYYYPSYGGYGYSCPPVSFSFGFRSGYRGNFHGGLHSAGFSGAGFHAGFRGGFHH